MKYGFGFGNVPKEFENLQAQIKKQALRGERENSNIQNITFMSI